MWILERLLKMRAAPGPKTLGFLVITLLLGPFGPSLGWADMRDIEFIRQNSTPFVTKAQKELNKYEKDIKQGNGERVNLLIRLSQTSCALGELSDSDLRLAFYEKGEHYAELLIKEHPNWADGYYWLALNQCGLAEVGGAGRALRLLPDIVEKLEKALSIDPTYDQAGAHRTLGRILSLAPAWPMSVGDLNKALRHLTLAVKIAPENSTNHLFLADTLMRLGKEKQAQAALQKVFNSTQHSLWPSGVEQDRRSARQLRAKLNHTN